MSQYVNYKTEPSTATGGPSLSIWADCPVLGMLEDPNVGTHFWDDFIRFDPATSAGAGASGQMGYDFYGDAGVAVAQLEADSNGVIEVSGNDADNDESVMTLMNPFFMVSSAAPEPLWFEAKVKRASIANNACAMFIGLAWDEGSDVSVAKTLCLTDDDGAIGAFSFLGFHVDCADGDAIDFIYKAEGQSSTVLIAGVTVPVANTYDKLGFKYQPDAAKSKQLAVFVDGAEQGTYATEANIVAATFPDAERLSPCWCVKTGATAESKAQMDWWRVSQKGRLAAT